MPAPIGFFRLLAADQAEWLLANGAPQRGALTALAALAGQARLWLVAPGEALTLHRLPLPSRKRSTWARAVPYALEDQVADDLEALHFAPATTPDGNSLPVAVIHRDLLRGWLDACAQAGFTPNAVIPEPLLLPWQPGDWSVVLENQRAVVRTGRWEGFAIEPNTLDLLLQQAIAGAGDAMPQRLRVWGGPPPAIIGLEPHIEDSTPEALRVFASTGLPTAPINLLQGPYGPQAQWGPWQRPWRAAAALAAAWLLVQGFVLAQEHWSLRREQTTLRTTMEQVYKDAVPGATRIVNPRVQLETRWRELRPSAPRGSPFLELLYQGGQPLADFKDISLRSFSYRDGQLELNLAGGSPATLDQLQQKLRQQTRLRVDLRATQREGQVESKITLQRTPS